MKIRLFTLPNFLTLANLACGCMAMVVILRTGDLRTAFLLMCAAAVFDFMDGFVARLLKSYSEVGKQLDSLADVVSFGLVPATILYWMAFEVSGGLVWSYLAFILALFSALRLAKFNIDDTQTDSFVGLPTPACALLVGAWGWLFYGGSDLLPWQVYIAAALVLSVLLICPLPMFALKFKSYGWRGNEVRYGFIAASVVLLIVLGVAAVPVIIILYILLSAVLALVCKNGCKPSQKTL